MKKQIIIPASSIPVTKTVKTSVNPDGIEISENIQIPASTTPITMTVETLTVLSGVTPPVVPPAGTNYSIFKTTDIPTGTYSDGTAIEVGVKFKATQNGFITGIRFYKGAANTGTHIGHLWNSAGVKLAEVTFTNETASGWQQMLFSSPVAITAGATYTASYFSSGYYAATNPYFTSEKINGPLTVPVSGGVYKYTTASAFPNTTWQTSNYWIDVIFNTTAVQPPPPPPPPPPPVGVKTFTPVQNTAWIERPFAGLEVWNNLNVIQPVNPLDEYYRFTWREFETTTQGSYNWTVFDNKINQAINAGRKFSFGMMSMYQGVGPVVGGATLSYPEYLHTQMQSEANKDWIFSGTGWIPNWNSNYYLTAWENLMNAVAAHITQKGWGKVIGYVDVRGYGNWGEWHVYPWYQNIPSGRAATAATLKRIIDSHITAFPNFPLVALIAGFEQGGAAMIPAETSYYLLTAKNAWGEIGWRRDQWGDPGTDGILSNNPGSYNGIAFKTLIINKWKVAPVNGEPNNGNAIVTPAGGTPYSDLERQIKLYHATSFGNGNYQSVTATVTTNILKAAAAAGARLTITSGSYDAIGGKLTINWSNADRPPTYEDLNVMISVGAWSGKSSFNTKFFTGTTSVVDNVPAGTIGTIKITLVDPKGYRKPYPLSINGRAADGSYVLLN